MTWKSQSTRVHVGNDQLLPTVGTERFITARQTECVQGKPMAEFTLKLLGDFLRSQRPLEKESQL